MTQQANFFKLGLFVILAFGIGAAFLIAFGAGKFFKKETLGETCFDESVQGLDIGSEVKYKGVKIGTVKTITTPAKLYNAQSNYVLVTFSLSEDCYVGQTGKTSTIRLKKAIAEGLSIHLSFKGLTGAAYLETDYSGRRETPLEIAWQPTNIYVPSSKSSIKRIGDALNELLDNLSVIKLSDITTELRDLLQTLNQKTNALNMAGISDHAENLLKEIRKTNQTLAETLTSEPFTRLIADAQGSFTGLKTIVENAKQPIGNTLKDFETAAGSTKNMAADLEVSIAANIDTLLESLNKTSKMMEHMIWLNSDTVQRAVENFEDTSQNLKQLSMELKQYPGRLLFERPPGKNTPEKIKEELKKNED
jgi:phospholipid/cholesterol/gamma-HCH transport system substrate-binding protein